MGKEGAERGTNDVRQLLAAQCVGQCIAVSVCVSVSVCAATNPISRFLCAFHSEVLGPEDEVVLCHLPFFYYINQLKQRTCNSFFLTALLCVPLCVCVCVGVCACVCSVLNLK